MSPSSDFNEENNLRDDESTRRTFRSTGSSKNTNHADIEQSKKSANHSQIKAF